MAARRQSSRQSTSPYANGSGGTDAPAISSAPRRRASQTKTSSGRNVNRPAQAAASANSATPNGQPDVPDSLRGVASAIQAAMGPVMERIERIENQQNNSAHSINTIMSSQVASNISPPLTHPPPQGNAVNPAPASAFPTLATASHLPSALPARLPLAVPPRVQDRILRGEFIDLDDLLQDQLQANEDEVVQVAVTSGRPLQLVTNRRRPATVKRRVHDLATWLEAWTIYARVITQAAPDRAPELLAYQSTIVEANCNYATEAWLLYDRKFRMALSVQPLLFSWAVIDANLWQSSFTSMGRPRCAKCSLVHPGSASGCPFRSGPSSAASSDGGLSQHTRFAWHNGKPICRNYNRGQCTNPKCPRVHVCTLCKGSHPESACAQASPSS